MGTLYVDRKNCHLELAGDTLTLRAGDAPVQHVPARLLSHLVLRSNVALDTATLSGLATRNIGITILGGRRGDRLATLVGGAGRNVLLRIRQVQRLDDTDFNREWCRHIVRGKLRAQQRFLQRAIEARPDRRKPLHDASGTLHECLHRLDSATDVDAMRGLEGAAAAAYFRAFTTIFPAALGFSTRNRRPPTDPVNACLSLGYTLLHSLAIHSCHISSLDPMIGYLHRPTYSRPSLACDLVEPWRSHVDRLVWRLFRERQLEAAHFGRTTDGACLLGKAGRTHFYTAWNEIARGLVRRLRRHAVLAARAIDGNTPFADETGIQEVS